jgi:hypothetical protein
MKDLQAAAATLLLSQRQVAIAIETINSKSDGAVPCFPTRCAITPTSFFASVQGGVLKQTLLAESAWKISRAPICAQNLRAKFL